MANWTSSTAKHRALRSRLVWFTTPTACRSLCQTTSRSTLLKSFDWPLRLASPCCSWRLPELSGLAPSCTASTPTTASSEESSWPGFGEIGSAIKYDKWIWDILCDWLLSCQTRRATTRSSSMSQSSTKKLQFRTRFQTCRTSPASSRWTTRPGHLQHSFCRHLLRRNGGSHRATMRYLWTTRSSSNLLSLLSHRSSLDDLLRYLDYQWYLSRTFLRLTLHVTWTVPSRRYRGLAHLSWHRRHLLDLLMNLQVGLCRENGRSELWR